jgi:hypothetical protein
MKRGEGEVVIVHEEEVMLMIHREMMRKWTKK